MSLQDFSTQFITEIQGINHFQQYNFEILNYTSLNFARPSKPTDSHTASMTAERRKLLDQLPRLNTNTNVNVVRPRKSSIKSQSKGDSESNASNVQNSVTSQSPDHDKNAKVTPRVKFVIDPNQSNQQQHHQQHRRTLTDYDVTADLDNDSNLPEDNLDHMDNNIDNYNRKKKNRLEQKQKAYRRASAPAQGIDYYFKNAKHSKMNTFYYNSIKKDNKNLNSLSIPTVHVEIDETAESVDNNDNNDNNDINNDNNETSNDMDHKASTSMSSSITSVSSCNPPSLSPCSSNSSLSSSIDMTSPSNIKQPSFTQAYNNLVNPLAMKQKSKSHPTDISYQTESHSLPDITSPYGGDMPWSPAALFLSGFANSNVVKPKPDEEGQQVGDYIIGKVIGRGGFSTVKQAHAIDQYSGSMNTVAVKIVRNHVDSDDNDHVQALLEREIAIWRRLDHPNIVRMLPAVEYDDYATFVFSEYCPGGTLLDFIKKHSKGEGKGLDEDEARNIFLEIAEGVRYLHNDMRLVHKDIKLDNILLDDEDTWKICDFGLTEFQNSVNGFNGILYNTAGGSIAYCAPEQLRSPTPLKDPSVDVWSLGVVLFAMVTGQLPFSDSFEPRLQFKIINGRYDESLLDDSGISNELRDLLGGMFKTKPDQRLTISQVLEHRWCER